MLSRYFLPSPTAFPCYNLEGPPPRDVAGAQPSGEPPLPLLDLSPAHTPHPLCMPPSLWCTGPSMRATAHQQAGGLSLRVTFFPQRTPFVLFIEPAPSPVPARSPPSHSPPPNSSRLGIAVVSDAPSDQSGLIHTHPAVAPPVSAAAPAAQPVPPPPFAAQPAPAILVVYHPPCNQLTLHRTNRTVQLRFKVISGIPCWRGQELGWAALRRRGGTCCLGVTLGWCSWRWACRAHCRHTRLFNRHHRIGGFLLPDCACFVSAKAARQGRLSTPSCGGQEARTAGTDTSHR